MKVVLASPNVLVGDGQSRVNYELALHLAGRGYRVTLLADRVDPMLAKADNIVWQRVAARSSLPALPREILWSRRITRWLNAHRRDYDIVHLNGASGFVPHDVNTCHFVHSAFRLELRRDPNPGVRGRYHRLHSDVNAQRERRAYALARRVVAVSRRTAEELAIGGAVDSNRVTVVHNGVDPQRFRPDAAGRDRVRRDLGITDGTFAMFFVGEFVMPRKGLASALAALKGLPQNTHLFVAGRGSSERYAHDLKPVDDRVHFLGFRPDVAQLYAAMDCFVYPTRYEACSLVVLEALASGVPVVTTSASGSGELIETGVSGFVLERADDVRGLREMIARLVEDQDLASTIGRHGRLVAEAHSWEAVGTGYEAIYESLV